MLKEIQWQPVSSMSIGEGTLLTRHTVSEPTFHLQPSSGSDHQSRNSGISVAELSIHLPTFGFATIGYPNALTFQQPTNHATATIRHGNNLWSVLSPSQYASTLEHLSRHCHSPEELRKSKYVLSRYSPNEISTLQRCKDCKGEFGN
jgi:hypothetical protein